jgi:hypothetical protein
MQFLTILTTLLNLLPGILAAIQAVEAAFPNAAGEHKLGAVTAAVTAAASHATDIEGAVQQTVVPIQSLISSLVGVMNDAGVLKHNAAKNLGP